MIEVTTHGDVRRIRMWTWRTRAAGYDVSAYVLRGVVVDTGFRHVAGELVRFVRETCPRAAILTHHHEDHAGNAPALARAGVPMWMPEYAEQRLRERPRVRLYRRVIWGRPHELLGAYAHFDPAPLLTVFTPGHAPDHHIVFDPDTATIISGDLWLGVKVRVVGRGEDPYQIARSLETAIALRPRRMFDAHRGLVEHPVEMLEAKRNWLQETIGEIERGLSRGDSEGAILKHVLGGEEFTAMITEGEYSRRNLVRAVARHRENCRSGNRDREPGTGKGATDKPG